MQCLQLTRGDPPKASMKWYFNQTITLPEKGTEWKINFTISSSTTSYHQLEVVLIDNILTLRGTYYIDMAGQLFPNSKNLYKNDSGWIKDDYRTITFATPPTDTLLSWLKANATPQ